MAFDTNVPVSTNQISNDLTAINANWEYVIHGDGTAGRVMRRIKVVIENGTNADTIKVTVTSLWNGDAISETDNISKDATTGDFTLSADGEALTIEASGLTGNCVAVLNGDAVYNTSGTTIESFICHASANDIVTGFYESNTGTVMDLTARLAGAEVIWLYITYLTDA